MGFKIHFMLTENCRKLTGSTNQTANDSYSHMLPRLDERNEEQTLSPSCRVFVSLPSPQQTDQSSLCSLAVSENDCVRQAMAVCIEVLWQT